MINTLTMLKQLRKKFPFKVVSIDSEHSFLETGRLDIEYRVYISNPYIHCKCSSYDELITTVQNILKGDLKP